WTRSASADTIFEIAPAAFIGGDYSGGFAISMTERVKQYDVGITLMSELRDRPGNLGIHLQRIVNRGGFEMGLGVAYWQNQTAWSANTTFSLHWGYDFGRWSIRHRHYSTGGASDRNSGLDFLT